MLRLERVSKFYSGNGLVSTGFSKVDLEFDIREFVAITGESGSGKSTLLNVISGLDSYEEGEMYIMGEATSGFSAEDMEDYRKKYIGSIFQTFNLINSYTVYQNVELVLLLSGYDKKEIPDRVREILAKVGLSDYEKTKASKLSGGQKQRVAIARALAKETPIIVADEPTGNLDSQSAAEIIALLHELSTDKLIIIVTHNYDQVEPYVTRKITMHDGRVAEDKQLKSRPPASIEKAEIKTAKADGLAFGSMARLGIRNTFNIPAKFLLLLIVFVFLCAGVIMQYTSVMNMTEMMSGTGYNQYFTDTGKNRILVTRADRGEFTKADYEKLSAIENVDKIVENDLMLDLFVDSTDDPENATFYSSTKLGDAAEYETQLTQGRMPQNAREAVIYIPKDGYIAQYKDELLKKELMMSDYNSGMKLLESKVKVVGYGYLTDAQEKALNDATSYGYCEGYIGLNADGLSDVREATLLKYCTQEIEFASQITEGNAATGMYPIYTSEEVPEGQIYIPEELAGLSSYEPTGRELKLTNKSIYFEDQFDFTVGGVYTKSNLEYMLDRSDFDLISGSLFINPADYSKMFDKGNFQSSVITSDYKITDQTAKAISEAGYDTFTVNDGVISYMGGFEIVRDTFFKVLLVAMMAVLFFITYFITKLILKSRNVYFSTIRMLGATKGNCSNLLKTELFTVFNIAFLLCMGVLGLTKAGAIKSAYLYQLVDFLKPFDIAVLYVILCVMAILLAVRYARQLFKKTAMNAYKEEV